ncbi:MAG: XRE family transcriptional regulator [bacterium]|nr:XRE family transcriptional regulator [bacterium]
MKAAKRKRLEGAGWQVGSTDDFLKLSKEEAAFVEMKLALADSVRRRRQARRLTQTQLANKVGSSQSRIAKMEVADASVSIDLLMKTLLSMGASRTELARVISRRKSKSRAA